MSVIINDGSLKDPIYNDMDVMKWQHNGILVYSRTGTIYKGAGSTVYTGVTGGRELTLNSSAGAWSGDINAGVLAVSSTSSYRLTALCDISSVTVSLPGSSWMTADASATLVLGYSKNGANQKTIVYTYQELGSYGYGASSHTFSNLKKGDYISLYVSTNVSNSSYRVGIWFGQYTVRYTV